MRKRHRLLAGALCAVTAGLIALGGCRAQQEVAVAEPNLPVNDGGAASLTVDIGAAGEDAGAYSQVLEEIIAKYRADFPDTKIELTENGDGADIRLFVGDDPYSDGAQPVDTGWLMDLTPYAEAWGEEGTVSNPANRIMRLMGGDRIYAIPCSYDQIMLYYRWDWFHEYNVNYEESQKAAVDIWGRLLEVEDKLGDRGRLTVSETVEPYLFDSILWSWLGTGKLADLSAGYYLPEEGGTVFTLEEAVNAVKAYQKVMAAKMDSADPMQDFIDGSSGMYLGTGMDMLALEGSMPGQVGKDWYAVGLPAGNNGKLVSLVGWTAWGVDRDTQEPEKAVHFLWYLTNADNNTHMYIQLMDRGAKPLYREVEAYEPSLLEGGWYGETGLLNTPNYKYVTPPVMFGEPVGARSPVFAGLLDSLDSGEIGPEELTEQLDAEYTRLLDEYLAKGNRLPWAPEDTEGIS